jgi:GT2 family glycosyltransferase
MRNAQEPRSAKWAGRVDAVSFSVIVCAYSDERWDDLRAAIASLERQTCLPDQIIVVVDHNPDLLERVCAQFSHVIAEGNRFERGLSGSRNTGIELARGDVIAFMDDDAVASSDWLERLAGSFGLPDVMGAGGSIIPRWDNGRPRWFPDEFDWVVGCTYRGMPQKTSPVRNLIGCNMALRREVFEKVGGFQAHMGRIGKLPVGCEETELCIRAQQQWPDARMIYDPAATVSHRVRAERATWRYFRLRCFSEGISKLHVSREVGRGDGLASERVHALRTLPLGALRDIGDACLHFDVAGLARAGVIAAGLAITAAGYVSALLSKRVAAVGSAR